MTGHPLLDFIMFDQFSTEIKTLVEARIMGTITVNGH